MTGPRRRDLMEKIIRKLKENPEGIWIRKLARELGEPVSTIYKYVTTMEKGYPGEKIEVIKKLPKEMGGHTIIRLKSEE